MKKAILILLLLLVIIYDSPAQELKEVISNSKKLGLVSYLTTIKSLSEHKMNALASNAEYKNQLDEASEFRAGYNVLKLSVDRLINQISADMTSRNQLKLYKVLNKYIKGTIEVLPPKFLHYKLVLDEISGIHESFMQSTYSSMVAAPSLGDIIGALELVHTVITDARDFREKKIQSIVSQLEKLKLEKIKDLTDERKKE